MSTSSTSSEEMRLRRSLSALSVELRHAPAAPRPDIPRLVTYDQIRLPDGVVAGRKKVILMSGGCSVPTCTMCPFTNENNYGLKTSPQALLDQVATVLERGPGEPEYSILALYNDGSFFAPREVPPAVQLPIAESIARSGVDRLVVESLPQFVTPAVLEPFHAALGGIELEIGIGLQSADDLVRQTLVNTRVSRASFERAVSAIRGVGAHPKVYLMIKPPFLTDAEAITDVVASVAYLRTLGIRGVTLCPTRVSRNTVAWHLWRSGHYQPPGLWTVVEAVRRTHDSTAVRVACINLRGTDFESVFPDSCGPACADRIVDALVSYSQTGDPGDLDVRCPCRQPVEPAPLDHDVIVARSLRTLEESLTAPGPGR